MWGGKGSMGGEGPRNPGTLCTKATQAVHARVQEAVVER
jgi:hypothetical protein